MPDDELDFIAAIFKEHGISWDKFSTFGSEINDVPYLFITNCDDTEKTIGVEL